MIGSNRYDSLFSFKLIGKTGNDNTFNDVLMLIESIEFTEISYDDGIEVLAINIQTGEYMSLVKIKD